MADLDDFFAKKDRKKGKTVKKFSTAEEIVKKIEDTKVKNDIKVKKDRQPGIPEGEEAQAMPGVITHLLIVNISPLITLTGPFKSHLQFEHFVMSRPRIAVTIFTEKRFLSLDVIWIYYPKEQDELAFL